MLLDSIVFSERECSDVFPPLFIYFLFFLPQISAWSFCWMTDSVVNSGSLASPF